MEEQNAKSSWKGCIIFGIINILLVFLCTKLNIMLVSTAMMLLIIVGVAVSAKSVKEDFNAGYKLSAIGCAIGVLLNCGAGVLYVVNILMGLVSMIMKFITTVF
ncbi:hypothetical protein [Ruminococcus albus]|uniref:DUF4190 domain-containing protein n=1 Tax=Ruminococcus albus TaxID=1264 RepID=A0A1H7N746_RUMAL|nr:hypothetical protein [Ruminococcus albus]SEL19426.1 hypothetical protein SAMN05216469_11427 [Ruminococcus albus]